MEAGVEAGLRFENGPGQLSDELISHVCQGVRPGRPEGHGATWAALESHEQLIICGLRHLRGRVPLQPRRQPSTSTATDTC